MKLFVSDTGLCFTVQASANDTVSSLAHRLEAETGIPTHAQILLTSDGTTLDTSKSVGDYPALQDPNAGVYLFNRSHIFHGPPKQPHTTPDTYEPSLSARYTRPLAFAPVDHSSSMSTRTNVLNQYHEQFHGQYMQAKALVESTMRRNEASASIFRVQETKIRSIGAAFNSLIHHQEFMRANFARFFDVDFKGLMDENELLFDSFEMDINGLRNVELHPSLRGNVGSTRKTLLDLLPEGRLREWLRDCKTRHAHLRKSVEELRLMFEEVQKDVERVEPDKFKQTIPALEQNILQANQVQAEQEAVATGLQDDFNWMSQAMQSITSQQQQQQQQEQQRLRQQGGGRAGEHGGTIHHTGSKHQEDTKLLIESVRQKDEEHCKKLQFMQEGGKMPLQILRQMYECKDQVCAFFYEKLQAISELQTRIRSCRKRMSLFKEGTHSLRRMCSKFRKIKQLPRVYDSCLDETKRRVKFQTQFMQLISNFEKELGIHHKKETELRREFAKEYWDFLNQDFFPFLRYSPPKVDINVKQLGKLPAGICAPEAPPSPSNFSFGTFGAEKKGKKNSADQDEVNRLKEEADKLRSELKAAKVENERLVLQQKLQQQQQEQQRQQHVAVEASLVVSTPVRPSTVTSVTPIRADESVSVLSPDLKAKMDETKAEKEELELKVKDLETTIQQLNERNNEMQQNNAHLEVSVDKMAAERKNMEAELEKMAVKVALLLKENRHYKVKNDQETMWKELANVRISYRSFQVQDIALFYERKGAYVAYNHGAPNRYLSPESQALLNSKQDFVLGKVIQIQRRFAEQENNPYSLPIGAEYFELTVEFMRQG